MLILHFIFINHVCETITSAQKYKTLLIFTENQQIRFLTLKSVKFIRVLCVTLLVFTSRHQHRHMTSSCGASSPRSPCYMQLHENLNQM